MDQEPTGGLHWKPATLASPSGLWCFMQQEGLTLRWNSGVTLVYDVTTETCPALWRITGGEMSSQRCPCSGVDVSRRN